jgi:hypothetical protein
MESCSRPARERTELASCVPEPPSSTDFPEAARPPPPSGAVPAPLEAVQDQVELELEPAHVVEAGLGEVLLDMLDEVG